MIADIACWERGCACHSASGNGDDGVEVQLKKEWVGLTDEEIKMCAKGGRSIGISFHDAICKAEAKLKEKNHG